MDSKRESQENVEQFYRLLSAYGLNGQSQPLNRRNQADLDKLFPEEEE